MIFEALANKFKNITLSDAEVEEFSIDNVVKLIIDGSVTLKCSNIARTKAVLIYHHFKRCVGEIRYEDYLVAAACLGLSIKFNKEAVEFSVMVITFLRMVGTPLYEIISLEKFEPDQGEIGNKNESLLEVMQKSVAMMECLILRMVEFCLNDHLAHEFVLHYMNDFREKFENLDIWDVLLETALKLATDFYLSNKCLIYKPDEIAVSVIDASMHITGVSGESFKKRYRKEWFKSLSKVSTATRRDIWEHIFKICSVIPAAEKQETAKVKQPRMVHISIEP